MSRSSLHRKLVFLKFCLVSITLMLTILAGCSSNASTTQTLTSQSTTAPSSTNTTMTSSTTSITSTISPSPSATASPSPTTPPRTSYNAKEIILSSTTSVRDSGLMAKLIPSFEGSSGYKMTPIYNGSGAALALGQKGEADVLVVHSPAAELTFMKDGYGSERRLIMHNDFVVLGPKNDPAKVKGSTTAVDAFKAILSAGKEFYSRGDNSGTDAKEKAIWKLAGVTVVDKSPDNPKWYIESGSGMGQLLLIASDKQGYTLSDRATFLANKATVDLDIVFEGDPNLLNLYHVLQVNASKFPGIVNAEGAKAFADFMVGPVAQEIIGKYTDNNGVLLFVPDGGKTDSDLGIK